MVTPPEVVELARVEKINNGLEGQLLATFLCGSWPNMIWAIIKPNKIQGLLMERL